MITNAIRFLITVTLTRFWKWKLTTNNHYQSATNCTNTETTPQPLQQSIQPLLQQPQQPLQQPQPQQLNLDLMTYTPIAKLEKFTDKEDDAQIWLNNIEKAITANKWNNARALQTIPYFLQDTVNS
ncbi:hypothetical protein G9A89_005174 [Geosiphon pyriformis]|nr:hypothetical protein G9A89_005174 [Geosiphon pyriformis]